MDDFYPSLDPDSSLDPRVIIKYASRDIVLNNGVSAAAIRDLRSLLQKDDLLLPHFAQTTLLLAKYGVNGNLYVQRIYWARQCIDACQKMISEDSCCKGSHARLVFDDMVKDASEVLEILQAESEERTSLKRTRAESEYGDWEGAEHRLKRPNVNAEGYANMDQHREMDNDNQLGPYGFEDEFEEEDYEEGDFEEEENEEHEKEEEESDDEECFEEAFRKQELDQSRKRSLADRIREPERWAKAWKIDFDEATNQWMYETEVLGEHQLRVIQVFFLLYENRPAEMDELIQKWGIDSGIIEGLDQKTIKNKFEQGWGVLKQLEDGVRDVHIHDRLVEAAPAQVPLPELDDDDLMMDEGLDEQDDLKDDAHAPA